MIKVDVSNNLLEIEKDIQKACEKSGRNPEEVKLIAVTKYVTIERAKQAVENGVKDLGENRPEGLIDKKNEIGDAATWHFIGSLQSRKVRDIVNEVDYIHSLDRMSLAKEINKRADRVVDCFVQVNTSGEESKHGLEPENVAEFVDALRDFPNIRVAGLMTMAPYIDDESALRSYFRKLRQLRDDISGRHLSHAPCMYLSMGMSNDYKIAIEEGATHIRIGTKLVGAELKR